MTYGQKKLGFGAVAERAAHFCNEYYTTHMWVISWLVLLLTLVLQMYNMDTLRRVESRVEALHQQIAGLQQ